MSGETFADKVEGRSFASSMKLRYLRHIVQAQVVILLLYGVSNPSAPIKILWKMEPILSISSAIAGTAVPVELYLLSASMILIAALFGRCFCGWICPLGFIQDLAAFGKKRLSIPEEVRQLKYALLFGGLIMPFFAGWTYLEWIAPMSIFSRAIGSLTGHYDGMLFGLSLFLIALILAGFTERRGWCRYICPLGALFSLISVRKSVGIKLEAEKCIECLRCERECTMGIIDVKGQKGLRWDSECITCLACRDTCQARAISLAFRQ